MKLYLISNNLVVDNISYLTDVSLEEKRINRPLSILGEKKAQILMNLEEIESIYASDYASAIDSAKYLAYQYKLPIYIDKHLRDSVIGNMGRHNIKMLRFMQERDFNFKYPAGESLNDTKERMQKIVNKIIKDNEGDIVIFTHKRAILSYLLDYTEHGFNLDDRLILTFNDELILDDTEKDMDIIVLDIENNKINDIRVYEEELLNGSKN